jgi:hypothetical protein
MTNFQKLTTGLSGRKPTQVHVKVISAWMVVEAVRAAHTRTPEGGDHPV